MITEQKLHPPQKRQKHNQHYELLFSKKSYTLVHQSKYIHVEK